MKISRILKITSIGIVISTVLFVTSSYIIRKKNNSPIKSEISSEDIWAQKQLSEMTLEEKVGQFFMVSAFSNQGENHLKEIESLVKDQKIGGIIFFQGERENLKTSISRFQKASKIPLLVGMDAEWGIQMRIFGVERFPYAYTIGAANDLKLSKKIGAMMAQECRQLGIHMNFSPVADVNSNPENPVIGFRSYGENPYRVAEHVSATVRGMEENGVMTSIKHFPGHGNTDKDSHFELPTVSQSVKTINSVDFLPFKEGIKAGASSVMIGHLNVPALDNSGLPSSLSKKIIKGYLQDSLKFNGLVISDALNMKAVSDKYGKSEVCVKAFEAGCDILLYPENVIESIAAITAKVKEGKITLLELNQRCLKVLKAKYKFVIKPVEHQSYTEGEIDWAKKDVYEKAITVLKNEKELFPLKKMNRRIARISIGMHTSPFREGIERFSKMDHYHFYTVEEANERLADKLKFYDVIITAFHAGSVRSKNDFGMPKGWREWLTNLPKDKENALILFGNPLALKEKCDLSEVNSIVLGYENNYIALERMSQFIFGAIPAHGKLPFTISEEFPREFGKNVEKTGRLKYSQPEELGIDPVKLAEIDKIAKSSITAGAFPGCQIVVAVQGKIIYQKSFGTLKYEDTISVKNTDVYDIASVTKIAGSTMALMKLQSEGKFSVNKCLKDYIPEVIGSSTAFGNILIKDMMTHQAGLTPWIPFYKKTVTNGVLNPAIYSTVKKEGFENQVAKDLWIKTSYADTMYKKILSSELGAKKYEYSDLGYYFIKKIVEKQTSLAFDDYLMKNFYEPMGLQYMRYRPLNHFPISQIAPTENDKAFRGQQIHGYVHDPGAAMLGGVGGHAGLFSNAGDLASLMQMLLNKGVYGDVSYINKTVIEEYTRSQFPGNRRGIGFDRPNNSGGGTCSEMASSSSFGHSGFTGTLAWADPEHQINYVFLSNRVYQNQDNWKIRDLNIRTNIQKVIYEAVLGAKK